MIERRDVNELLMIVMIGDTRIDYGLLRCIGSFGGAGTYINGSAL